MPFKGATFAETVLLAMRQEPVPPRRLQPGVPRDLETICLKCLEKRPGKRYESALADDLADWSAGRPIRARAVGPAGRTARWAARNPAVAALSVAVCLVAMAGLTGIVWGWNESRRNAATAEANALDAKTAESVAREAEGNERGERYRVSLMAASGALRLHDSNAARGARPRGHTGRPPLGLETGRQLLTLGGHAQRSPEPGDARDVQPRRHADRLGRVGRHQQILILHGHGRGVYSLA